MAKRFDDLSDEEVLALSEDDLQRWIDVECAFAGVPLLPEQPTPPDPVAYQRDMTVHEVGSIFFRDSVDAARAAEFLSTLERVDLNYASGPGYERIARSHSEPLSPSAVPCYSAARWDEIKVEVLAYNARKAEYDKAAKEYAEAVSKRDRVASSLIEQRDQVVWNERERSRLRAKLERYRVLAEGNESTARKFLRDAHPEAVDLLPELSEPIVAAAPARES